MFFFTKRLSIDKLPNLGTLPKKPNPKTHTSQTLLQTYEAFPWCPKVPKLKIVKQILAIKKRKKNTERWYKYKQYRFMGRLLFKKNKHHNYMNHSTALASLERMNGRSVFWTRQITNRLINRKVRAFGKNQKTYFRWIWQRGNNMGSIPQKTKINVPIRHLPTDVQRIHKSTPPRPIPTGKTGCNSDSTPKNPMVGGMSTLRKNHIIRTATRKLKRGYKKLNNMANILHHLMRNLHTDRKYTTKKITHNPIKYRKIAERLFTRNPCKGIKVTKFKTRPTFVRAPYRKTSLRDITSYLMKSTRRLGTYQKTISPNRPAAFGKDRTPRLLTGPLSLGNKNSSLFICKNLRLKKPARQYIKTMKRYAIIIKPHQKRLLRYSRLIFSTLLMLVSKDLTLLTEYVFSIYKRQPYFRHRKIFYALRKLLKVVFSEGNRLFGLEGISFKLKGKVAVRGGLRKRVFKVRHGEYSSANTNRIHKYRFKQLWTKGGAVSLKVSILHK